MYSHASKKLHLFSLRTTHLDLGSAQEVLHLMHSGLPMFPIVSQMFLQCPFLQLSLVHGSLSLQSKSLLQSPPTGSTTQHPVAVQRGASCDVELGSYCMAKMQSLSDLQACLDGQSSSTIGLHIPFMVDEPLNNNLPRDGQQQLAIPLLK